MTLPRPPYPGEYDSQGNPRPKPTDLVGRRPARDPIITAFDRIAFYLFCLLLLLLYIAASLTWLMLWLQAGTK